MPGVPPTVGLTDDACFLFFFILWSGTAAYLVYRPTWAPEMTQVSSMVEHSDRGPHRRRMLSVLQVFYSMVGHCGIPGVPSNMGPTDDACFLFYKFFILWSGHSGIPGVPPTVGPSDDTNTYYSIRFLFYGRAQRHTWCTSHRRPHR